MARSRSLIFFSTELMSSSARAGDAAPTERTAQRNAATRPRTMVLPGRPPPPRSADRGAPCIALEESPICPPSVKAVPPSRASLVDARTERGVTGNLRVWPDFRPSAEVGAHGNESAACADEEREEEHASRQRRSEARSEIDRH